MIQSDRLLEVGLKHAVLGRPYNFRQQTSDETRLKQAYTALLKAQADLPLNTLIFRPAKP